MPFEPERSDEQDAAVEPGASDRSQDAAQETDLQRAQRERDEYLGHWQRSQADYQNLRRRLAQDIEAANRRAKQPLLLDVLLVLDQLEMALAVGEDGDAGLREGVRLTREQLLRSLENEGVKPVPDGGAFDPKVHQAVATLAVEGAEPGTVVGTLRRGFTWGDQVLRFAQVQVAGAPHAARAGEED